jgi:hypothetical protein
MERKNQIVKLSFSIGKGINNWANRHEEAIMKTYHSLPSRKIYNYLKAHPEHEKLRNLMNINKQISTSKAGDDAYNALVNHRHVSEKVTKEINDTLNKEMNTAQEKVRGEWRKKIDVELEALKGNDDFTERWDRLNPLHEGRDKAEDDIKEKYRTLIKEKLNNSGLKNKEKELDKDFDEKIHSRNHNYYKMRNRFGLVNAGIGVAGATGVGAGLYKINKMRKKNK